MNVYSYRHEICLLVYHCTGTCVETCLPAVDDPSIELSPIELPRKAFLMAYPLCYCDVTLVFHTLRPNIPHPLPSQAFPPLWNPSNHTQLFDFHSFVPRAFPSRCVVGCYDRRVFSQFYPSPGWRRVTLASGFRVRGISINPGTPGFPYLFHPHKSMEVRESCYASL